MTKPETFFDIYEKTKPTEVIVEQQKDDKLFEIEETKPENNSVPVQLPEGFEDALVKKITSSILASLQKNEGGTGDGDSGNS